MKRRTHILGSVFATVFAALGLGNLTPAPTFAQGFEEVTGPAESGTYAFVLANQEYDRELAYLSHVQPSVDRALTLFEGLGLTADRILVHRDLDRIGLEDAIAALGARLPEGARLLVYVHGVGLRPIEAGPNRLALPGLRVRPGSESYLVERRVERASISLDTLVKDLRRTPAESVVLIHDACAATPLNGASSAKYWEVVSREPCLAQPVAGADVIYGGAGLAQGDFMAALLATLGRTPGIGIDRLDAALREEMQSAFGVEVPEGSLVFRDPEGEARELACLVPVVTEDGVVCPGVAETDTAIVPAIPEEIQDPPAEADAGTATSVQDDGAVTELAATEEEEQPEMTEDAASAEDDAFIIRAPTTQDDGEDTRRAGSQQAAWNAARAAGTCEAHLAFLRDFSGSPFALKARMASSRLCSDDERAAFDAQQQATVAEPSMETEPEVVEEVTEESTEQVEKQVDEQAAGQTAEQVETEAEQGPNPEADPGQIVITAPQIAQQAPAETGPNAFAAWRAARDDGSCDALRSFRDAFSGTPFALRAEREIGDKCGAEPEVAANEPEDAPEQDPTPVETARPEPTPESGEESDTVAEAEPDAAPGEEPVDESIAEADPEPQPEQEPVAETGTAPEAETLAEAVFIVNDDYAAPGLSGPAVEADLARMQEAARALGVPQDRTRILRNLGKIELQSALAGIVQRMTPDADLMVYYAGHSLSLADEDATMMLPSDFVLPDTGIPAINRSTLRSSTVSLADLSSYLRAGRPRRVTMIFNGCGPAPLPDDPAAADLGFLDPEQCVAAPVFGMTLIVPVPPGQRAGDLDPSPFVGELSSILTDTPAIRVRELEQALSWGIQRLGPEGGGLAPAILPDPRVPEEELFEDCLAPRRSNGEMVCTNMEGDASDEAPPEAVGTDQSEQDTLPPQVVAEPEPEPEPEPRLRQTATQAWRAALGDGDCMAFRTFLAAHPESLYGSRAKLRIRMECSDAELAVALPVEEPPETEAPVEDQQAGDENAEEEQDAPEAEAETAEADPVATEPEEAESETEAEPETAGTETTETAEAEPQDGEAQAEAEAEAEAPEEEEAVVAGPVLPDYCLAGPDPDGPHGLARDGYRRVQARLNALECPVGGVDGLWGGGSQRGYDRFVDAHEASWPQTPVCETVARLEALPTERVCPLICPGGTRREGDRCVPVQVSQPPPAPAPSPAPAPAPRPAPTPTATPQPQPQPEPEPAPAANACKPMEQRNAQGVCVPRTNVFSFN